MKIVGLKHTDPWFGRLQETLNSGGASGIHLSEVPVELTVRVDGAHLAHHGPELNHRPYLVIRGEASAAVPAMAEGGEVGGEIGYGINEIKLNDGGAPRVDYFYEFSDAELADLTVRAGLYQPGFGVPQEIVGMDWNLPAKVDFLVVSPSEMDEPPVVFFELHDQNDMQINTANSGYELAQYFPDYVLEGEAQHGVVHERVAGVAPSYKAPMQDLFAGMDLSEQARDYDAQVAPTGVGKQAGAEQAQETAGSTFDRLVNEQRERTEARSSQVRERLAELDPETPEALYAKRVAPGVEDARATPYEDLLAPAPEEEIAEAEAEAEGLAPEELEANPAESAADAAERARTRARERAARVQEEAQQNDSSDSKFLSFGD